jgi:signal transduction histidine kinase
MPVPSTPRPRSPIIRYSLAVAFVAAALATGVLLRPVLTFSFFLAAVLLSGWFGGIEVGLFAVLLSITALTYILQRPPLAFWSKDDFTPRILTFTSASFLVLYVVGVRRRAERALRAANTELERRASARLARTKRQARRSVLHARLVARFDERTRLAREIHDTLLQGFTGVSLQLLAAMGQQNIDADCKAALGNVLALAQETLVDARRAVWDMRPPALEGNDFATSLRVAIEQTIAGTTLNFEYLVRGETRALEPEVETGIFRVAQEAAANVAQHAAARTLRVLLVFRPRSVAVVVADDGSGFAVDPDLQTYAGHWGLLGMRERASQLHARLKVRSVIGRGTRVMLHISSPPRTPPDQGIAADSGAGIV